MPLSVAEGLKYFPTSLLDPQGVSAAQNVKKYAHTKVITLNDFFFVIYVLVNVGGQRMNILYWGFDPEGVSTTQNFRKQTPPILPTLNNCVSLHI